MRYRISNREVKTVPNLGVRKSNDLLFTRVKSTFLENTTEGSNTRFVNLIAFSGLEWRDLHWCLSKRIHSIPE